MENHTGKEEIDMARNAIRWMMRPIAHCKEGCLYVS